MRNADVYIDLPKSDGEVELLVQQPDGTYKHIYQTLELNGKPTKNLKEARKARKEYIEKLRDEGKSVDGVRTISDKLKASVRMFDDYQPDEPVAEPEPEVVEAAGISEELEAAVAVDPVEVVAEEPEAEEEPEAAPEPVRQPAVEVKPTPRIDRPEKGRRIRNGRELQVAAYQRRKVWCAGRIYEGGDVRTHWKKLWSAVKRGEAFICED